MLKAGGMLGSLFSLFVATFDIGIITLPVLAAENDFGTTAILVVFGALISYFCAMLLVDCADKIGKTRYEDFAMHCWGRTASKLVGACILTSLLGFVTSYIADTHTLHCTALQLQYNFETENRFCENTYIRSFSGKAAVILTIPPSLNL